MSTYLVFAIFPVLLFFLAAVLVTGAPVAMAIQNYYANRGRQSVKCPDNGEQADVQMDHRYAFSTALRGQEHTRLDSCSRWPEMGDCGQECLAQIDQSPENLERLFSKFYDGKSCALCTRALTPNDWRQGRVGVLNAKQELFEMRDLPADDLQLALENTRPLCWRCHLEECERQAVPHRVLKGDRYGLASLHDTAYDV
jgi:hypothetical protein